MTDVRVIAAWAALVLASGVFIAMLIGTWRHQANEFVWSLIPWVIVALCVAPSAIAVASIGQPGVGG